MGFLGTIGRMAAGLDRGVTGELEDLDTSAERGGGPVPGSAASDETAGGGGFKARMRGILGGLQAAGQQATRDFVARSGGMDRFLGSPSAPVDRFSTPARRPMQYFQSPAGLRPTATPGVPEGMAPPELSGLEGVPGTPGTAGSDLDPTAAMRRLRMPSSAYYNY